MEKYLEIIKNCPLFEGIEEKSLTALLNCLGARVDEYGKRETVFFEGREAKHIGIVLSGAVQTEQSDCYGNRNILSETKAPQIFGEAFACADVKSIPVSVVATEPSHIMLIDSNHILSTCSNACSFHRSLIYNLMKALARKNIEFHRRIEITSKRTTREKLMSYLTYYAKKEDSRSFDIPFDRQELADYLEVERSGLSAEISKLRREGIIESNKKHFVLL